MPLLGTKKVAPRQNAEKANEEEPGAEVPPEVMYSVQKAIDMKGEADELKAKYEKYLAEH